MPHLVTGEIDFASVILGESKAREDRWQAFTRPQANVDLGLAQRLDGAVADGFVPVQGIHLEKAKCIAVLEVASGVKHRKANGQFGQDCFFYIGKSHPHSPAGPLPYSFVRHLANATPEHGYSPRDRCRKIDRG
ncbi:hypothetical protein D3C87_1672750 [compost metagenome]